MSGIPESTRPSRWIRGNVSQQPGQRRVPKDLIPAGPPVSSPNRQMWGEGAMPRKFILAKYLCLVVMFRISRLFRAVNEVMKWKNLGGTWLVGGSGRCAPSRM